MNKNFLYPASFFYKETSGGFYTSTYPVINLSNKNHGFEEAKNKWKFWHPETKFLYTSKKYLLYKRHDGTSHETILKDNTITFSITDVIGENEFVNSDTYNEYEWKVMPLTFSSNSIGSEPEFISNLPEKSLIGTNIYVGKIIHFGTFERTRNWGEEIIVEYITWWESEGEHNFHKYEQYYEELFQNESPSQNLNNEGDSWMDDPENYWNID